MVIVGGWRAGGEVNCCRRASLLLLLVSLHLGRRATQECAGALIRNFRFQTMRPENKVRDFLKGKARGSNFCFSDSTVNES